MHAKRVPKYVFYDGQWQFKPKNVNPTIQLGINRSRCQLRLLISKIRGLGSTKVPTKLQLTSTFPNYNGKKQTIVL